MSDRVARLVRVFDDLQELSGAAARAIQDLACRAVERKGHVTWALSGGSTPGELYRYLAAHCRQTFPWKQTHLFWGDERYVVPWHPQSNFHMVREALLDSIGIPGGNVHPMPTRLPSPQEAAAAYEMLLQDHFPGAWPDFDLVLLGLGADGHTASLFPGTAALSERQRWVTAATAAASPWVRLTLTLPVINHAACVYFLAAGREKAAALRRALAERPDPWTCPASAVRPQGELIWWVDREAASLLEPLPQ